MEKKERSERSRRKEREMDGSSELVVADECGFGIVGVGTGDTLASRLTLVGLPIGSPREFNGERGEGV